jgi:diadenosine tetraphosphate (Ap4A) HIT family hydrolase
MELICPFCSLPPIRVIDSNELALTIRDGYPVSSGHTLIIPKRHVASFFDATPDEKLAILELMNRSQQPLIKEFSPDGFNIGINDGPTAGQTVPHLHVHIIPRFKGDQDDPRGGVRWIIPGKAKYWK